MRLRSSAGGDARLVVRDQRILDALRPRSGRLRGGDMRGARVWTRALTWTGATAGVLVGLYFALPLLARPLAALVPLSWEESLGRTVMRQVTLVFGRNGQLRQCTGAAGQAAIERLVGRLAATVESRYTFRVQVVDTGMVNALAAPGGYIMVFRGLIDKARTPEEVAGVIGHEMGHVIEQHGTQAMIRSQGMRLILGGLGDGTAVEVGSTLATLSYGRAAEREADRVGVTMLNKADIRGGGLAEFFRRLGRDDAEGEPGVTRYISTHPPSAERAGEIDTRAVGQGPAMSAEEWQALRAICTRG